MSRMISPTGQGIRVGDAYGSGLFGAGRGGRLHLGCDFLCQPGQAVIAPAGGKFRRISIPYAGSALSGVIFDTEWGWWRMFYLKPDTFRPGELIERGQLLGTAQDCTTQGPRQYLGMQPHVHFEVWLAVNRAGGGAIVTDHPFVPEFVAIDPQLLMLEM